MLTNPAIIPEWTIYNAPASATAPSATKAAGGAGVCHVLRSILVSAVNQNSAGGVVVSFVLRDGASGVGSIIYGGQLASDTVAAGGAKADRIEMTGLAIKGSANTAMCVETNAGYGASQSGQIAASGVSIPG